MKPLQVCIVCYYLEVQDNTLRAANKKITHKQLKTQEFLNEHDPVNQRGMRPWPSYKITHRRRKPKTTIRKIAVRHLRPHNAINFRCKTGYCKRKSKRI
jgi:hypothetical protein